MHLMYSSFYINFLLNSMRSTRENANGFGANIFVNFDLKIFIVIHIYENVSSSSSTRLMKFDRKSLISLKRIMENKRITCVDGVEGE